MAKKSSDNELVSNRKAYHDYEILDTYEAGMSLLGTEVKSLREHAGSLKDSYIQIIKGEMVLKNCHISHYSHGNIHNHPERRERKLLLHRSEINKLFRQVQEKGVTLIPLSIYLRKGRIKLKLASAKGKKLFEKRESLKAKEHKREIQKILKGDH